MCNKKAFVIGLDCLTPQYFLEDYLESLPNIRKLLKRAVWGRMRSTIPPITCPAWASMVTGKDPGSLGIYGFRNRLDFSYDRLAFPSSEWVKEKTIWDIIAEKDKKSIVLGVPPSYPPKEINGIMLGCFLTPDTSLDYAYPKALKGKIETEFGKYMLDVENFRTTDKNYLSEQIYKLSENKFGLAEYLMKSQPWDLFMFVDMGPDRFHHGFWKYFDRTHNKYTKGNKYENSLKDYYIFLDQKIQHLIDIIDEDTTIYIVSDHGAKKIDGGFCVNEWLIKKGYLSLKNYPKEPTRLEPGMIDWTKTKAWGEGGYYARVFFNVKGREPQGVIEKSDYKKFREEITRALKKIKYLNSDARDTVVHKAEDIYDSVNGIPPDLFIFFGDLLWRSVGSVGFNDIYTSENDTGPDDANHNYEGVFIMHNKKMEKETKLEGISIYDFAPTVLKNLGFNVPGDMKGRILYGA